MKSIIPLCILIALTHSQQVHEIMEIWEELNAPFVDICINETNANPEIPKVMFRNNHLPDEGTFHCYLKCMFRHLGFFTPNNEIDVNALAEVPHLPYELAERCVKEAESETDLCIKSYLITKCCIGDKHA
ncbi:hypothetical protein RI129_004314 [Pyrocoelia pectoralis]|uniref:Uncharacterized protein n=1 Tax=Pyrocoelia pectoralis TaxID=417401 RepID=A0AAN7VC32_9COLE